MVVNNSRGIARHKIDLLDLIVAIHVRNLAFRTVVECIRDRAADDEYVTHGPGNFQLLTAATSLLFSNGSYIVLRKQFYCNMYVHS